MTDPDNLDPDDAEQLGAIVERSPRIAALSRPRQPGRLVWPLLSDRALSRLPGLTHRLAPHL